MKKIIISYVPVWSANYESFFACHPDAQKIYVLGRSITHVHRPFVKDLRSLDPHVVCAVLQGTRITVEMEVLENVTPDIFQGVATVVMPDEDISRDIAEQIPEHINVIFDNSHLLRWDAGNSRKHLEVGTAQRITSTEFLTKLDKRLADEASRSPDLWRQVAGAIFDGEQVFFQRHNQCVPSGDHLLIRGDPRGQFQKGEGVELSIFLHAEAGLIADAARTGLALSGKSMYVSTFPCPACGKLIAFSGIKKLYFKEGYAMLDSEEILVTQGVELIQVQF